MNVLVVSQYFWPESFRINDLVLGLVEKGHKVTVLTAKPNYPHGNFFKDYSFFGKSKELYEGVEVLRVPIVPRYEGRGINLIINYLSFLFFASTVGLWFCRGKKFDVVFSYLPSPLTSALPAILIGKLKSAKVYLWVQDLWPESVEAIGAIKSNVILGLIESVVRVIYKYADLILVSSRSFSDSVKKYLSTDKEKVLYYPNSVEELFKPIQRNKEFKEKYGIPEGFILMFAGNIGHAQDFPNIINTAEKLKDNSEIKFVILGEGRNFSWVKEEVKRRKLEETVFLLGRHPMELMPHFFAHADAMLVTLKDEPVFRLTVPCKIQSYLACAKPIISAIAGEGGELIKEAGAGIAIPPSDSEAFVQAILELYNKESNLDEMSKKAHEYHMNNFHRELLVSKLENWMQKSPCQ